VIGIQLWTLAEPIFSHLKPYWGSTDFRLEAQQQIIYGLCYYANSGSARFRI
jgi:hypothetical protein